MGVVGSAAVLSENKKYGLWTTISVSHKKNGNTYWNCKCECGTERVVRDTPLKKGASLSCGCAAEKIRIEKKTIHGHASTGKRTSTYRSWEAMVRRCNSETSSDYHNYGGRGIKVCQRWLSFPNFYSDMGDRPKGSTLDRIDVNGDYEPSNCRWATPKEQANNRR